MAVVPTTTDAADVDNSSRIMECENDVDELPIGSTEPNLNNFLHLGLSTDMVFIKVIASLR